MSAISLIANWASALVAAAMPIALLWSLLETKPAPVLYSVANAVLIFSMMSAAVLVTGWLVFFAIAATASWPFPRHLFGFYALIGSAAAVFGFLVYRHFAG